MLSDPIRRQCARAVDGKLQGKLRGMLETACKCCFVTLANNFVRPQGFWQHHQENNALNVETDVASCMIDYHYYNSAKAPISS